MLSDDLIENLVHTVNDKTVNSGAWLIFVKGMFANYFINVSVIVAMIVKEYFAKIVVLMMGVTVFAFMGYEHVIANSALFAIALLEQPASVSVLQVGKNFLFSFLGNYVGGGLAIGLFYAYLNDHRRDVFRRKT
jgi:formate/nitrite transporter FocA (FNT family)